MKQNTMLIVLLLTISMLVVGCAKTSAMDTTKAVTEQQARGIATAAVPGTVTNLENEDFQGQKVFTVEVNGDTDVKVAVASGQILATEKINTTATG